jgi:hypothetical protein
VVARGRELRVGGAEERLDTLSCGLLGQGARPDRDRGRVGEHLGERHRERTHTRAAHCEQKHHRQIADAKAQEPFGGK